MPAAFESCSNVRRVVGVVCERDGSAARKACEQNSYKNKPGGMRAGARVSTIRRCQCLRFACGVGKNVQPRIEIMERS